MFGTKVAGSSGATYSFSGPSTKSRSGILEGLKRRERSEGEGSFEQGLGSSFVECTNADVPRVGNDQRFIAAVNVDRVVEQDVHVNAPRTKADLIMPWRESRERGRSAMLAKEGEKRTLTPPVVRPSLCSTLLTKSSSSPGVSFVRIWVLLRVMS